MHAHKRGYLKVSKSKIGEYKYIFEKWIILQSVSQNTPFHPALLIHFQSWAQIIEEEVNIFVDGSNPLLLFLISSSQLFPPALFHF